MPAALRPIRRLKNGRTLSLVLPAAPAELATPKIWGLHDVGAG